DEEANAQRKKEPWIISAPESKVTVLVYPTNEELAIAQQTLAVARG
ncbi:MAG: acetate kinase, partial [Dermabacter sp.]|nr:acetate kinase [Dermabacter sp.]